MVRLEKSLPPCSSVAPASDSSNERWQTPRRCPRGHSRNGKDGGSIGQSRAGGNQREATVPQLTTANLALTTTVATLTSTNKKLVDAAAKKKPGATTGAPKTPAELYADRSVPGGYCWTHGHWVRKSHTSKTCSHKDQGHQDEATAKDTMGGS